MAGSTPASATGLAINGTQMCFISAQPLFKYHLVDPNPQLMCGTLDDIIENQTAGIEHHGWRVLLQPHPGELDVIIPLTMTEGVTDSFTPDDTPTAFTTLVRLKSSTANAISTTGCVIDKMIIRGQKGLNPISMQLDILGLTSTETATFSPATITANAPYPFTAGTLTSLAGTARAFDSFVLVYDNHIRKRFNNSVTADVLQNVRRTIHLGVNIPYTDDEDDLFTSNIVGATRAAGFAATLTYSRSNYNFVWTFPKVTWEAEPPPITGKESEIRSFMWMKAAKSGSNAVVTVTQDNTG